MNAECEEDYLYMSDQDMQPDTSMVLRHCEAAVDQQVPISRPGTQAPTNAADPSLLTCGEDIREFEPPGLVLNNLVEEARRAGGGQTEEGLQREKDGELSRIREKDLFDDDEWDFMYEDLKRKRHLEKHPKRGTDTSEVGRHQQQQQKQPHREKPKQKPPSKSSKLQTRQTPIDSATSATSADASASLAASHVIDHNHSTHKFKDEATKRSKGGRIRSGDVVIGLGPNGGMLFVSVEGGYTYSPKLGNDLNMLVCSQSLIADKLQEDTARQNLQKTNKREGRLHIFI